MPPKMEGTPTSNRTDAEVITSSLANLDELGLIFERHYEAVLAFIGHRFRRSLWSCLQSISAPTPTKSMTDS